MKQVRRQTGQTGTSAGTAQAERWVESSRAEQRRLEQHLSVLAPYRRIEPSDFCPRGFQGGPEFSW